MAKCFSILLMMGMITCFYGMPVTAQHKIPYDDSVLKKVVPDNPSISLEDYLRRLPGIMIVGGGGSQKVIYRNISTIHGENSPLFVIDGRRVGTSLSRVKFVLSVVDIADIRFLKPQESSIRYGIRAGNGAIVIKTKQ